MKVAFAALLLLALAVGPVRAQAGFIGLYTDHAYTDCTAIDPASNPLQVHVVHMATPGATASRFKLRTGGGFAMTYLAESCVGCFGDLFNGIHFPSYFSCVSSPIWLASITYYTQGLSEVCSYLEVIPDPASATGTIEVIDCGGQTLVGGSSTLYVNPDGTCECGIPTGTTNWGRVKALYAY